MKKGVLLVLFVFLISLSFVSAECSKVISDVRITDNTAISTIPSLVWTGSEYGVVWADDRDGNYEIYFARISSAGIKVVGSETRITNAAGYSEVPSLKWTGSEYGVAWKDNRDGNYEIYFARISSAGSKVAGSEVRITDNAGISVSPSLVWTGSEYGVAWTDTRDGNYEIYFARISSAGSKVAGSETRITNAAANSVRPSLVWTGSEYGVAWDDQRDFNDEVYFARISSAGSKVAGSEVRITNNAVISVSPSLVWTGSEYGVAWVDSRDGNWEIYFARISSAGIKVVGSETRITNAAGYSRVPSLKWTGSEYGVAWEDNRDGNEEVYFARISSAGIKVVGSDVRITDNTADSLVPSLVWTGLEYGVTWVDLRDANWEIYFARISCCADTDNDDLSETPTGCGTVDQCPETAPTAVVDSNGCSCDQKTCSVHQQCNPTTIACECLNPCSSGQKQCSGNSYQPCAQDANLCWYWDSAVACILPTPTCYDGNCVSCTLPSECVTPPDDPICYLPGTCTGGSCVYTKKAEGTSCGTNMECNTLGMCVCSADYTACPGENCYNLQTDTNNCGSCGYTCSFANAAATCSAGICVMSTCNAGYYDINNDPTDGCEYACTPMGVEVCDDGTDQDCNGEDPQCPCTFTKAYWSHTEVTGGTKVKMTVEASGCDGQAVYFNIYEDDILFNEDINDEYVLNPEAIFENGKAEAAWFAIYVPDGSLGVFDPPEYYFNAMATLPDSTTVEMRSQDPVPKGLLRVWPNKPPAQPEPFLIKPNGGEFYVNSANITWNPAVDPEDDAVVYTLYYLQDSGASWNSIAENYGYLNKIGERDKITIGFR